MHCAMQAGIAGGNRAMQVATQAVYVIGPASAVGMLASAPKAAAVTAQTATVLALGSSKENGAENSMALMLFIMRTMALLRLHTARSIKVEQEEALRRSRRSKLCKSLGRLRQWL